MKADRVVVDTNVLISAVIASHGKPRAVLQYLREHDGRRLMSAETMDELATRLQRPKFDRYLSLEARRAFLNSLSSLVETVEVTGEMRVCRDADDDKIIETAVAGKADCLVTGDKDLLSLRPDQMQDLAVTAEARFQNIAILTPAEFLAIVSATGTGLP